MTSFAVGEALPDLKKIASNIHRREGRTTEHNIHDDEAAQKMGFRGGLVAGGQSAGMISQLLVQVFGVQYFKTGRIQVRFVGPVFEGDDLTIGGVVTDRVPEDGGTRVFCDVWIAKEDGAKAVVGKASAVVPD